MIELPDDELDKLFRKSSEELDPQFDPEDWDSLKKRLDETDGKTPAAWFRKWWSLGVLLLLIPAGIASYYLFGNESNNDVKRPIQAVEKDTRMAESSSKSALKVARTSKNSLPRSLSKAGGVYLEPNRSKREGGDGALSLHADEKVHKNDPKGTSASELGARQAAGSDGVTPDRVISGMNENVTKDTVEGVSEMEKKVFVEGEGKMQFVANYLSGRSLTWDNAIPFPAIEAESVKVTSEDTNGDKVQSQVAESPKWAIRLGYSPDLTTVGFKNFTKPGTAFSFLLEYGVTRRLYIQTGVVRTRKDYYAPGSEYEFKPYVTSINTPDSLDGLCLMYEIPLGIRYDFVQTARSRLFAGTGFSSYYIQKEEYRYYYSDYVHGQRQGWQGKSGLALLSHLNASIGYERSITRRLSILAEPYIRIPLKGVGYGKVNLTTMGMWLSLRYTPAFR
jgi:hypothetical protein